MTHRRIDLTGMTFGRLTVINSLGVLNGVERWLCKCSCGVEKSFRSGPLRYGATRSCGCFNMERRREVHTKHGQYQSPVYNVWQAMKDRCTNPQSPVFKHYGARGITVCQRWLDDFVAFASDMGPRPRGHTLERIDNDGNYEPANCRWATRDEQLSNRRNCVYVTINGETRTVTAWARIFGIKGHTVHERIRLGWDAVDALRLPVDKSQRYKSTRPVR